MDEWLRFSGQDARKICSRFPACGLKKDVFDSFCRPAKGIGSHSMMHRESVEAGANHTGSSACWDICLLGQTLQKQSEKTISQRFPYFINIKFSPKAILSRITITHQIPAIYPSILPE
ncbi:hypothetical protein P4S72_04795 [Vibrio sp. PP-XX7]